jgi:hypothetical protein
VGIERTQATQFFLSNGQGSGLAADNTVPLVANKALILRVYVDRIPIPPTTVTGRVLFAGSPAIAPLNVGGAIPAMPSSAINRGNANHTLNFLIPPSRCRGSVTFTVTVFEPGHQGDPAHSSPPQTVTAIFDPARVVRIHGVLIHYTGGGRDIAAPSGEDLVRTLLFALKTYPISGFNYTGCEVVDFCGDITLGGPGCGTGWNQLLDMLSTMRMASGTTDIYVGLLPTAVPLGRVGGCGSTGRGVAASIVGWQVTMAQEIAHTFMRLHAPCGTTVAVDPSYPNYAMFPRGSIGEFGFDPLTNDVFDPATTFDFMGSCRPAWVSPYTFLGLKGRIENSAAADAAQALLSEQQDAEGEFLHLNFRIRADERVEVLPSFHLEGPAPTHEARPLVAVWCDLLGPEEQILEAYRCHLDDALQEPDARELAFHEIIRWHPETRAIAFRRHGEVLDRYELGEPPPEIALEAIRRRDEVMRLEWKPAQDAPALTYLLRYSHDGGATWRAVAADLSEPGYTVSLELLPGGEDCRFQIISSSGIRTTITESEAFAVPVKPVQPHILEPQPDSGFSQGEGVVLIGGGFSPDFETTGFDDVAWSSSIDGYLGVGYVFPVPSLSAGRHRITLSVPDGLGDEATAGIFIEVRPVD